MTMQQNTNLSQNRFLSNMNASFRETSTTRENKNHQGKLLRET